MGVTTPCELKTEPPQALLIGTMVAKGLLFPNIPK